MVMSWRKGLTSRLEKNLLKLNILGQIGLVSKYATVGSSKLISVGKHAFTDRSWKKWDTLMSSKPVNDWGLWTLNFET